MNHSGDKSLFFITLSFVCIWLVVDMAIGKNYLGNFLSIIFPFMDSTAEPMTEEQVKEAQQNAPSSSAIGSGKKENSSSGGTSGSVPGSLPYGASR